MNQIPWQVPSIQLSNTFDQIKNECNISNKEIENFLNNKSYFQWEFSSLININTQDDINYNLTRFYILILQNQNSNINVQKQFQNNELLVQNLSWNSLNNFKNQFINKNIIPNVNQLNMQINKQNAENIFQINLEVYWYGNNFPPNQNFQNSYLLVYSNGHMLFGKQKPVQFFANQKKFQQTNNQNFKFNNNIQQIPQPTPQIQKFTSGQDNRVINQNNFQYIQQKDFQTQNKQQLNFQVSTSPYNYNQNQPQQQGKFNQNLTKSLYQPNPQQQLGQLQNKQQSQQQQVSQQQQNVNFFPFQQQTQPQQQQTNQQSYNKQQESNPVFDTQYYENQNISQLSTSQYNTKQTQEITDPSKSFISNKIQTNITCQICYVATSPSDFIYTDCCKRKIHKPCYDQYIISKAQELKQFKGIICPYCPQQINYKYILKLLNLQLIQQLLSNGKLCCYKCKTKIEAQNKTNLQYKCQVCNVDICTLCGQQFHQGKCEQESERSIILQQLSGEPIIVCPFCDLIQTKDDKCDHVTCSECKNDLCAICSVDRYPIMSHGNHFHRYGCTHYSGNVGDNEEYEFDKNCQRCWDSKDRIGCKKPISLDEYKIQKKY